MTEKGSQWNWQDVCLPYKTIALGSAGIKNLPPQREVTPFLSSLSNLQGLHALREQEPILNQLARNHFGQQ